jgi:hypothetical protein
MSHTCLPQSSHIVFLHSVLQLLVTANIVPNYSYHYDDGGNTFLQNISSYKSHTASHPRQQHYSEVGIHLAALLNFLHSEIQGLDKK